MPWGYANYECKRTTLGQPLVLCSRPPFKLDLETHSPTPQGYRVFGVHPPDSPSGLGLSHLTGKVGLWQLRYTTFDVLKKCKYKFGCLVHAMLINHLRTKTNSERAIRLSRFISLFFTGLEVFTDFMASLRITNLQDMNRGSMNYHRACSSWVTFVERLQFLKMNNHHSASDQNNQVYDILCSCSADKSSKVT